MLPLHVSQKQLPKKYKIMKTILFLFLLLVLVVFGGKYAYDYTSKNGFSFPSFNSEKTTKVIINKQQFSAKIADTEEKRQIGLSQTNSLGKNEGMIFIFDNPNLYSFWMKDMKFPIDIIYINNEKIVKIFENVQTQTGENLTVYTPDQPANRVLEINAGQSKKYDFKVGDKVTIENLK